MRYCSVLCIFIISCSPVSHQSDAPAEPPGIAIASRAVKIEQLVGDFDRERNEPVPNLTQTQYGLVSTDLGVPFDHNGRTFILFGDSFGGLAPDDDAIAWTRDTDPGDGLSLTFIHNPDNRYRAVAIPGISQGAFEVPVEGVSVDDIMYVYHTTDYDQSAQIMGRTVLARSYDNGCSFEYVTDISSNRLINVSIVEHELEQVSGYPVNDQQGLVLFSTGPYRKSRVFLACQRSSAIEYPDSIYFLSGTDSRGNPVWTRQEQSAAPVFSQTNIGELSAAFYSSFGLWILLYNHDNPRGITVRAARRPWGPWSDGQIIFEPWQDKGYGHFMHTSWDFAKQDSVHDPGRENEWGGEYGPYQFEHLASDTENRLVLYFTMSTWNPYTVVLMKAVLDKNS